ncbi:MAG: 2-oxoglutarate dehydrogenase E1 component, partial [Chloroflexota bacterium]
DQPGASIFFPKASIPVIVHGDASFPGQGVVAETLNLSRLPGYQTAGTIHIMADNQLGFTATTQETRSSRYASDLAKGFKIPVIYVNADDPEACIEAVRIGFAYRDQFKKDFMIDLVGYRRYGHNEGDEPSFTQPLMYESIRAHPSVRELWARTLVERGLVPESLPEELVRQEMDRMQAIFERLEPEQALDEDLPKPAPQGAARRVKTGVPVERLRALNQALMSLPEGFHINRKLERSRERRLQVFDDPEKASIDWATAEELAFASILEDGIPIRLTGEDVVRGTFSQRHAHFYDVESGAAFSPLQALPQAKAAFETYNSPVTETAVVGFEYGYNLIAANRLVLWEAQYGDFINISQVIVDEFLASARAKWGQAPSLVLLLPHGNEGQGPDHSSARPERFLQLTADKNLRLAYPTTAAQYFHLLRRQAALLTTDPLPLVVLTPKGLLRNPLTASRPLDLAEMAWQPVINDGPPPGDGSANHEAVCRLALCSGRIYVDLVSHEGRQKTADLALARVEQLAPFPADEIRAAIESYPRLEEILWVQEEPRNMGAWDFVRPRLEELIAGRWPLRYLGRPPSSSPAEGSSTWYAANQRAIVEELYRPKEEVEEKGVLIERG